LCPTPSPFPNGSRFAWLPGSLTGLVPEHIPDDRHLNPPPRRAAVRGLVLHHDRQLRLEGLGSSLAHPVANAENIGPSSSSRPRFTQLGHLCLARGWLDRCYASCLYPIENISALVARSTASSPGSMPMPTRNGLWASGARKTAAPSRQRLLPPHPRHLRPVRTPAAHPEKAIDTILFTLPTPNFSAGPRHACNVLDVVHPFGSVFDRPPIVAMKRKSGSSTASRCPRPLAAGRGMAFDPLAPAPKANPACKATEMCLASSTSWRCHRLCGSSLLPARRRSPSPTGLAV